MSTQHTPGPWSYLSGTSTCEKIIGADGIVVADPWWSRSVEEVDANARLIAASPELLEVLQVIAADSRWTSGEPLLMQVRAAIAKAEGAA